jgi:uncharacterized membrane protein YgcG
MSTQQWWQSDRWALCAPDTYVLKHGAGGAGAEPFKLALMELATRGGFQFVKEEVKRAFGRKRQQTFVAQGPKPGRPREVSLAAIYDLHAGLPAQPTSAGGVGVPIDELVKRARSTWGSLGGYALRIVLPALIGQGLYAQEARGFLFFKWKTPVLTPAGQQAKAALEAWATAGSRDFPELVQQDPGRAVAFAALAGSSLLLTAALYPELRRLRERIGEEGYNDVNTFYADTSSSSDTSGSDFQWPQFELDSLGIDLDFSAFDSIGDISSDIDSGISDAGGSGDSGSDSGGGDGGGGDGGGGGGD